MPVFAPQALSANTLTDLGSIGASMVGVCSQVIVTNASASAAAQVRVAISATTTPSAAEYLVYDVTVPPNDSITIPVADYIAATYHVMARSTNGSTSFRVCGRVKDA